MMKTSPSLLLFVSLFLSACHADSATEYAQTQESAAPTSENQDKQDITAHNTAMQALLEELNTKTADDSATLPVIQPIITSDGKTKIDWTLIDSQKSPADKHNYPYPFALDSLPVKNYADSYGISPAAAQHSMTVIMAAPEALAKIADQLTGKYLGHEFKDGANATLIIHTTADVVAEHHNYVFVDKFAEGLVLPIVIAPKAAQ